MLGQVLSYDNIRDIIKFCKAEKLVLLADEVDMLNKWLFDKSVIKISFMCYVVVMCSWARQLTVINLAGFPAKLFIYVKFLYLDNRRKSYCLTSIPPS